ncbi:MAG: polysaccharide deacetylase family protein [Nitrospirae bacterium]|nr:polysaccharide deacetylase family protein [Nitrospirota bacterium]
MNKKTLKRTIKLIASNGLTRLGLLERCIRLRDTLTQKPHTVFLMYHRVVARQKADEVFSLPQIVVYQDSFERQMEYLSSHYRVLSLDQYIESIKGRIPLPSKTAVITFDDGWRDNFLYAFPLLKKFNLPATIFLTTGFIATNRMFWQESVIFLVSRLLSLRLDTNECFLRHGLENVLPLLSKLSAIDNNPVMLELIDTLKQVDISTLTALTQCMRETLNVQELPYAENMFLDWTQIIEMQQSLITFGSHGISHQLLDTCGDDVIAEELTESKKTIEGRLSSQVKSFAYPNGNYNSKIIERLKEAGYEVGVTVLPGLNTPQTDPFQLKRINICENRFADLNGRFSEPLFAASLSGILFK